MVPRGFFASILIAWIAFSAAAQSMPSDAVHLTSPDGQIAFTLATGGAPDAPSLHYSVDFRGRRLIDNSELGLDIQDPPAPVGEVYGQDQPPLGPGLKRVGVTYSQVDETYPVVAGKSSSARNHYHAAQVDFEEETGLRRKLSVEVRVFDDGVAFRYRIPAQNALKTLRIVNERTKFRFSKDSTTYPLILAGFQTAYEDDYQMRMVSSLHPDWLIGLPLLADVPGVAWVAITEADIENYAGMYLRHDAQLLTLKGQLSPRIDLPAIAVETVTPMETPWRVLMIGEEPGRLIESDIVLNLNPPSRIADTSWIRPGKTAWDWWSDHTVKGANFTTGMNTATMMDYIDFAADSGFPYMLIDGGWAARGAPGMPDDITRTIPEIDMPALLRHAKERNVRLWLWAHWRPVYLHMDEAFPLFEKWGVAGVKVDWMNRDDQWMIGFERHMVETAAGYHLMIDFHGISKPDGLRRTYPNLITQEGVMGKEYAKWSARVSPVHNTTLPFTRMLAGPMDYTPGAFSNSNRENFVARNTMPMSLGTRAHELALFVVFESPFEMVSDYPEQYEGQKDFDFIKQVPTTWDETRVLSGLPMESITLARRSGKDWYIGSLTNWDARDIEVPLHFLGPGKYIAEIYADAPDAAVNATHTTFSKREVDPETNLKIHMVSGGGNAIRIYPASNLP